MVHLRKVKRYLIYVENVRTRRPQTLEVWDVNEKSALTQINAKPDYRVIHIEPE
jgi:hypothetical protein